MRPTRGLPPSAEVMFHTAARCDISSIATSNSACRQRPTASGLVRRQPVLRAAAQAEGRVQVRAHEVVLELGGFVERVQDGFTIGQPRRCDGFTHGGSPENPAMVPERRADAIRRPAGSGTAARGLSKRRDPCKTQ